MNTATQSTLPESARNSTCLPDAELLYRQLLAFLQKKNDICLVGIASGGAWIAQRLATDLDCLAGVVSSTLHRDDFAHRGLSSSSPTQLPFAIDGKEVWLIDDVLYTGRTIRAVLNELFDYGRPRYVRLATLVDRGERELPIAADFTACQLVLQAGETLQLQKNFDEKFYFVTTQKKG